MHSNPSLCVYGLVDANLLFDLLKVLGWEPLLRRVRLKGCGFSVDRAHAGLLKLLVGGDI